MARPLGDLDRLGARVASLLAEHPAQRAQAVERARRGFLEREIRPRRRGAWFAAARVRWAFGVGSLLVVTGLLVSLVRPRAALRFQVNGAQGVAHTWLAAPPAGTLTLAFSEGTRVLLEARARARVTELDEHGASLTLESGQLRAEVVHRADGAWQVAAGPFTVRVTGTVFAVGWDPTTQQLAVTVDRGGVSVKDASTGVERAVAASQTLRVSASEHRFRVGPSSEVVPDAVGDERALPTDAASSPAADSAAADVGQPASAPAAKSAAPLPAKPVAADDEWRAFAKRGALREAFASALAAGFTDTCATASPSELLTLGDGARLSGDPKRAEEALLTLRRRYPADGRRAAAAFALGKVAFDQKGAYEQAAAWFSTSLREQPAGPLARDAAGRLIEALRRADDSAGARRAARDYLEKYPEGPHADLARSILR